MKNTWITSIIAILLFANISAQDDIGKKFRFGLRGNISTDWLSPDNAKDLVLELELGHGLGLSNEFD